MIKRFYFYRVDIHKSEGVYSPMSGVILVKSWLPNHQAAFSTLSQSLEKDLVVYRGKLNIKTFEVM